MKIIREQMVRYGDKDFDEGYIDWEFHDISDQKKDAESILDLIGKERNSLLDVACGIGSYHKVWVDRGISVTGIDISETFIKKCKEMNSPESKYIACDLTKLQFKDEFDVATWVDPAYLSGISIRNIFNCLKPGGIFIFDARNPNFPKYRSLRLDKGKTWSCEDGIYKLYRDEYNYSTQKKEYEIITIDTNKDEIKTQNIESEDISILALKDIMYAAGFKNIRYINRKSEEFELSDDSVQRFWVVGYKY